MQCPGRQDSVCAHRFTACLATLAQAAVLTTPARAGSWASYAENAQHTALNAGPSQVPQAIRWSTPVDLDPQYVNGVLYTHYGSPVITAHNIVILPVKTQAAGNFTMTAIAGRSGDAIPTASPAAWPGSPTTGRVPSSPRAGSAAARARRWS
jgi:hypothetical protein